MIGALPFKCRDGCNLLEEGEDSAQRKIYRTNKNGKSEKRGEADGDIRPILLFFLKENI